MNSQEVSKYRITVTPEDYKRFVIYGFRDDDILDRIAFQITSEEIVCMIDLNVWEQFTSTPNDPSVTRALRAEMAEMYFSSRNARDPETIETIKSHLVERIGEQISEFEAEARAMKKLQIDIETMHDVRPLLPHLIREFGIDHGQPIAQVVEQVVFLLHPELFEDETAGESREV